MPLSIGNAYKVFNAGFTVAGKKAFAVEQNFSSAFNV